MGPPLQDVKIALDGTAVGTSDEGNVGDAPAAYTL